MSRTRRLWLAAPELLLIALVVAACARREEPLDLSTPAAADQEVQVTLRDNFTITVSPTTVKAGRVKFNVTNEGSMSHGMGIEGQSVEQFVTPGTTLTRETQMTARTWTVYCPIADHRDRGMQAQLVAQ